MTTIAWAPGARVAQDPNAILDYTFDLTGWLKGATLTAATPTAVNCTVSAATLLGNTARYRVSAVTAKGSVRLRVQSNNGQVDDFTLAIFPQEQ